MKSSEQKLAIENLLSNKDVFARCVGMLKHEYFDPEYRPTLQFLLEYFEKYHNIPSIKAVNAKFPEMEYETVEVLLDHEQKSTADDIELFCQQQALFGAIEEAFPIALSKDRTAFAGILQKFQSALEVSLVKDLGIEMFDNPEATLTRLIDDVVHEPCGITDFDDALNGGFVRTQFTLFSANSGVGKSIMLANLGANYAKMGYRVLLLSLELSQDLIFLRNTAIMCGVKTTEWKENIPQISQVLTDQSKAGGSFIIKRIPNGACANDIRGYLKHYEMSYKEKPDIILVDYLDLMTPNGGVKSMSVSEQDKYKSEQLSEIGVDYNAIVFSASQQNREAIRMATPDQGVIAGGLTKVNTVDNYISLFMSPSMRVTGDMGAYFLKTRSSSAVGTSAMLKFNADTLQITGTGEPPKDIMKIQSKKRALQDAITSMNLPGLPDPDVVEDDGIREYSDDYTQKAVASLDTDDDEPPFEMDNEPVKTVKKQLSSDNPLLGLMQSMAAH